MAKHEKSLVKISYALARFDPKARKELVVRGLTALSEVRDANFYFFKGEEHRMRDEEKQAISYYEKALQIDPEHENSLFWMGYCYSPKAEERAGDNLELDDTTRNNRAKSAFQKLVDMRQKRDSVWWGGDCVIYYNLGVAQYNLGMYEAAIESNKRAIELNPIYANSYYSLAFSQDEIGIYHLALENFEKYLVFEDNELSRSQKCIAYAQRRVDELRDQLTDDYFFSVGLDFWNNNQYQEAIECNEKAIEINPIYSQAYYNLALAQEILGIYHLALENFKKYLALDEYRIPRTPECVEHAKNRVKEIRELLTYIYFDNTGIEFYKKGQYKKAVECYEQAIELNPSFADVYYNLALAQDILNLHNLALDNFEIYLGLENHELSENQQFITYATNRIKELRGMLRSSKKETKLFK